MLFDRRKRKLKTFSNPDKVRYINNITLITTLQNIKIINKYNREKKICISNF